MMLHRSKSLMFAAVAMSCAAMMLPSSVEARGGGGRGGGGGGGGGGRGMGGGGMGGRSFNGGSNFRGVSPGAQNFTRSGNGNWNGNRGNWNGGRWNGGGWNRWNYNRGWGWGGWGWWIGPGYWGFGGPYWYGGYPLWYDTLAAGSYVNPYYSNSYDYGGFDYGAPIQQQGPAQSQNQSPQDDPHFAAARAAFYAGNYQEALREITQAITDMPASDDVHEFHGLVLFAMGDYQRAAAIAHTTLDSGPGWNWNVVQTFYPSADTYTQQLRGLEHYISEHPNQAATRFLLGYQYLTLGHMNAARRQFDRVVALEPRDQLAKNIVAGLSKAPGVTGQPAVASDGTNPSGTATSTTPGGPPTGTGGTMKVPQGPNVVGPTGQGSNSTGPSTPTNTPATPPTPPPATPSGNAVSAQALNGTWKSSPAPGVTIEATLKADKHFTWKFTEGGQSKSFSGTYTVQGDNLVLTRDEDGQKMDGTVTMNGDKGFKFRLRNTDPNDPGLEFSK